MWQKLRETGSSEHFTYEITESGTVTVTGYTGPTGNDVTVTVPARIDDKPVTAIGPGAFRVDISAFCAIILPDGLVRLDEGALSSLSVTEPLVIPAGVTEIGDRCFSSFSGAVSFAEGAGITRDKDERFRRRAGAQYTRAARYRPLDRIRRLPEQYVLRHHTARRGWPSSPISP